MPVQLVYLSLAKAAVFAEYAPLYSQIHLSSIKHKMSNDKNRNIDTSYTCTNDQAPSSCQIFTQISYICKYHQTQEP